MKAEKIYVKIEEIKRQFYHDNRDSQFMLDNYQSVAAAITEWLAQNRPSAIGGFWTGEIAPPGEISDISELAIICIDEQAKVSEERQQTPDSETGPETYP